jgi:hypothetical protein
MEFQNIIPATSKSLKVITKRFSCNDGGLCNGSTTVFGAVCGGSNPPPPAKFAYGEFGIEVALSSPTKRRAVAAEIPK